MEALKASLLAKGLGPAPQDTSAPAAESVAPRKPAKRAAREPRAGKAKAGK